jgi:carbon starvation protein
MSESLSVQTNVALPENLEAKVLRNSKGYIVGTTDSVDAQTVGIFPRTPKAIAFWVCFSILGAFGWSVLALSQGEEINTIWFVLTGVCSYIIGYRFYALYIQKRLFKVDNLRATPSEVKNDGADYDPTDRKVLFGHHFASIAGAGPLVGPVLAAQMGYLPCVLWIVFGVIIAGGVQDMITLFFSHRRGGRTLAQIATDEVSRLAGALVNISLFLFTLIVIAVLGIICVNAMAGSSWAFFSVSMTIPIALFMGLYMRYLRPGKVNEASIIGVILLLVCVFGGAWVAQSPIAWMFTLDHTQVSVFVIIYAFIAVVIPAWVLLTPRDYLSTFMKIGTIVILAVAVVFVRPTAMIPAFTNFAFNTDGPAFAGSLFPFLFITIACGALSGLHASIAAGTTPKLIQKESQTRMIGYGGMLMESFVALMALVAAISLNPGVYYAMNTPAAQIEKLAGSEYSQTYTPEENASAALSNIQVMPSGAKIDAVWNDGEGDLTGADALREVAADVGENSIVSRTGGAPTLAVSMSNILQQVPLIGGKAMMGFWYHFAIMFEALFILSVLTAATKSIRFNLKEALGKISKFKKFGEDSWVPGNVVLSAIIVLCWGTLLIMGVNDPNGGIYIMYPLFGIANQLISVIALALIVLMVIKKGLVKYAWIPGIPLLWVVAVTFTANFAKIFSDDPNIGYFKMANAAQSKIDSNALTGVALEKAATTVRNCSIQGVMSVLFFVLVISILVLLFKAGVRALVKHEIGDKFVSEDPYVESNIFGPSSFMLTKTEKAVLKEIASSPHDARASPV